MSGVFREFMRIQPVSGRVVKSISQSETRLTGNAADVYLQIEEVPFPILSCIR